MHARSYSLINKLLTTLRLSILVGVNISKKFRAYILYACMCHQRQSVVAFSKCCGLFLKKKFVLWVDWVSLQTRSGWIITHLKQIYCGGSGLAKLKRKLYSLMIFWIQIVVSVASCINSWFLRPEAWFRNCIQFSCFRRQKLVSCLAYHHEIHTTAAILSRRSACLHDYVVELYMLSFIAI